MKMENLESLVLKLRQLATKAADGEGSVVVGYTAAHAIFVHEYKNPKTLGLSKPRQSKKGVYWGPSQYGPKFLEGPARSLNNDGTFRQIVVKMVKRGATMVQALLVCGLRLQRESQVRVPVEYGALRASAFTRVEK